MSDFLTEIRAQATQLSKHYGTKPVFSPVEVLRLLAETDEILNEALRAGEEWQRDALRAEAMVRRKAEGHAFESGGSGRHVPDACTWAGSFGDGSACGLPRAAHVSRSRAEEKS